MNIPEQILKDWGTATEKNCQHCGALFEGLGIMNVCETCAAVAKRQEETRSRAARIPAFDPSYPKRAISDLSEFAGTPLKAAQSVLAAGHITTKPGIVAIVGDRGRGKTVMATWWAEQRRQMELSTGTYLRAMDLFAIIKRTYAKDSTEDESSVIRRFQKGPFLVIDEFQERSESDWENRILVNILDHRHGNMLPSVVIANLTPAAFEKQAGPSIVDRVSQSGCMVECKWEGFR